MASILGQHFLKDKKALKKIVAAMEVGPRDVIIEIGPGHGELTEHLIAMNPRQIVAVEKDKRLAESLRQKLPDIEIIEGDILKILPALHSKLEIRNSELVGNIPYYITGHLLRKISELEKKPKLIVFTVQKEVAERICAQPPKMNLLAASVQFWGEPKIVGRISKKAFRPPPKVDSAIIKITPYHLSRHDGISDIKKLAAGKYYEFIKILFKQPRKTILNNLRAGPKLPQKEIQNRLQKLNISPNLRPANLSMSDINKLALIFSAQSGIMKYKN